MMESDCVTYSELRVKGFMLSIQCFFDPKSAI